jgi:uncharacterized membrane protein YraQ (UPF0718 family)
LKKEEEPKKLLILPTTLVEQPTTNLQLVEIHLRLLQQPQLFLIHGVGALVVAVAIQLSLVVEWVVLEEWERVEQILLPQWVVWVEWEQT